MHNRILEVVNNCLEEWELTWEERDKNLMEAGLDSISFIIMVVSLEDEFGCHIPDEKLQIEEMDTLRKIEEILYSIEADLKEETAK